VQPGRESEFHIFNDIEERDLDMLGLFVLGYSDSEVAAIIEWNKSGVQWRTKAVSRKLGLQGKAATIKYINDAGLLNYLAQNPEINTPFTKVAIEILEKEMETQQRVKVDGLTTAETAVLTLIADGLTSPEIAKRLGISVNTANWHTGNIFPKLGVNDRCKAAKCVTFSEEGELIILGFMNAKVQEDNVERREERIKNIMNRQDEVNNENYVKAVEVDIERRIGTEIDEITESILSQPGAQDVAKADLSFPMANRVMLDRLVRMKLVPEDALTTGQIGIKGLVAVLLMHRSKSSELLENKETLPYVRTILTRRVDSFFEEPEATE
jgi:DNA-binding NarL/FixJ family response regulator